MTLDPILLSFLALLGLVEVYYWFWWLPRHWKSTREAEDFMAAKRLYGKDGVVWKNMDDRLM